MDTVNWGAENRVGASLFDHHAASLRGETTGVAAVAGGQVHGDHGCC